MPVSLQSNGVDIKYPEANFQSEQRMTQLEMENREQEKLSCLEIKEKMRILRSYVNLIYCLRMGVIAFRDAVSGGSKGKKTATEKAFFNTK